MSETFSEFCKVKYCSECELLPIAEGCSNCEVNWLAEHDKQIRADERTKVLSTLRTLVNSDYNSKECKLLFSDLCEFLEE